jgi:FkbM family methyltransferase
VSLGTTLDFILRHPLNRGARVSALGRFLHWQLLTRISPDPVSFPFVEGLKFVAERGMTGASGNYYCGLHELDEMAFVLHALAPGDVFYDVGANVGSYTMLAAAAGAKVEAFEPSPTTAVWLSRNVAANSLQEMVRVHECALGPAPGEVLFTRGTDTTNHVLVAGEAGPLVDKVRMETLDENFDRGKPALVKIDVEGFEASVLEGATEALASPSLFGLIIEWNGFHKRYGTGDRTLQQILSSGLHCHRYDARTRIISPADPARRGGNLLFLRDAESAQARVSAARRFRLVNGWI